MVVLGVVDVLAELFVVNLVVEAVVHDVLVWMVVVNVVVLGVVDVLAEVVVVNLVVEAVVDDVLLGMVVVDVFLHG